MSLREAEARYLAAAARARRTPSRFNDRRVAAAGDTLRAARVAHERAERRRRRARRRRRRDGSLPRRRRGPVRELVVPAATLGTLAVVLYVAQATGFA